MPSTSFASARESSTDRLSGVVTSTVGRRVFCALRSPLDVSPLRAPAVQSGCSASSGCCSARKVSAASARIGVSQSTVSGGATFFAVARAAGFGSTPNAFNAPSHTA